MISEGSATDDDGEPTGDRRLVSVTRRRAMTLAGIGLLGTLPSVAAADSPVRKQSDHLILIPDSVTVNETGEPIHPTDETDPETGLYDADEFDDDENRVPLMTPDGERVTWGEYSAVDGSISVKCLRKGTHATIHVDGLIPKGLYTIWVVVFADPGFDGTFQNLIGAAPLGRNDGSQNTFRASRSGQGHIAAIDRQDTLTMEGPAHEPEYTTGECLLTDEFEVHFVGAYHWDDESHGPVVGPHVVEQFAFAFREGEPLIL